MFVNASGTSDTGASRPARAAAASHHDQRRTLRWVGGYLLVILAAAVLLVTRVAGQQPAAAPGYAVWEVPAGYETPQALQTMERARRAVPSDKNPDQSGREWAAFSAFYNVYIFAKMTQPDFRSQLSEAVRDIQKDLERAVRSGSPAAGALRSWIAANAKKLATGNYHPTVRVSATLLLGQLDDRPAVDRRPPVPSRATLVPLVNLYRGATSPDGVRAAALQGLHRWVRYGYSELQPAEMDGIASMMFELAAAAPPAGRDPAAHAFLQRYAVDILAVLNSPQRQERVTQTLVSLSTSPQASPLISLYAAESLGWLSDEISALQQPDQLVGAWAAKAAAAFQAQADRLSTLKPPLAVPDQPRLIDPNARAPQGGYAAGYGGGGYGASGYGDTGYAAGDYGAGGYGDAGYGAGGYGDAGYGGYSQYGAGGAINTAPQPPEVIASRRKINKALQSLNFGLTGSPKPGPPSKPGGLIAKVDAPAKASVDQLVTAIQSSATALNDTSLITEEAFIVMLLDQAATLQQLADSLAPPAEPTAEPADAPDVAALGAAN